MVISHSMKCITPFGKLEADDANMVPLVVPFLRDIRPPAAQMVHCIEPRSPNDIAKPEDGLIRTPPIMRPVFANDLPIEAPLEDKLTAFPTELKPAAIKT